MLEIMQISVAKGLKHFFYGGVDNVIVELTEKLESRHPGDSIVRT